MKKEKMISVFILCPNDFEKPVLYFQLKKDADDFAKSYRDGANVSDKPDLIPERIVNAKSLHVAKYGHVL